MPSTEKHKDTGSAEALPLIAQVYQHWALDTIVELAYAISFDFFKRPRHYRKIPESIANILSNFRSSMGSNPDWPNLEQRDAIYRMIMNVSFQSGSAALREAVSAYSANLTEKNEKWLQQTIIDIVVAFRAGLMNLQGGAFSVGLSQINTIFGAATQVLRSREVAQVFGLQPALGDDWPLSGVVGGEDAVLIEEISRRLLPASTGIILEQKWIALQRISYQGAWTIAGVLDERPGWDKEERLTPMLTHAYQWRAALIELIPDIVRSWKDPEFRQSLSNVERAQLPDHPAGEIEPLRPSPRYGPLTRTYACYTCKGTYVAVCCSGTLRPDDPDCNIQDPWVSLA